MSPSGRLAALAWMLSCAACSSDEPRPPEQPPATATRDPAEPLQTDATSYRLVRDGMGWRTDMTVHFRNTFPDTLYAVNCNGALTLAIERREGSGWRTFWAPMTNACLSPPVTIPPGGEIRVPLAIWGAPPGSNAGPQFPDTAFAGSYRLVWWNLVSGYDVDRAQLGDSIPTRYRLSNEFSLSKASDG